MSVAHLILAALLPAGLGGSQGLTAEGPPTKVGPLLTAPDLKQEAGSRWVFSGAPHIDLWFHGMAMVDPVGPGPLPLYDPSYPTRIRVLKERTGVPATPLDQRAGYFRDAFNRDPAFEVLHFLPLYFGEATRTEVFAALERLAVTGDGIPSDVPTRARFGAAAIGAVLSSPGQRALLGEFVSVLSAEWEGFFSDYRREGLPARNEIQAEAQSIWDQEFGPLIGPLLQELNLAGGTVFLSPAIGIEGRIFSGVPQNQQDNILVVSAPTVGDDARAVIFSMLREVSFPLVRQALASALEAGQGRGEAEGLAARAAIQTGALILQELLPGQVPAYQTFFLSRAGRTGVPAEALSGAFQNAYPLEEKSMETLRETIRDTITNGGEV